jgi:hypothetical protein
MGNEQQVGQPTARHIFGQSDFIDASEYIKGTKIEINLAQFLRTKEYESDSGVTTKGIYMAKQSDGTLKEYRMGLKVEKALRKKYAVTSYEAAVGKTLVLEAKKYNVGMGWELVLAK